jgi:hypothetical protein
MPLQAHMLAEAMNCDLSAGRDPGAYPLTEEDVRQILVGFVTETQPWKDGQPYTGPNGDIFGKPLLDGHSRTVTFAHASVIESLELKAFSQAMPT